jgi:predicted lipoprotein with Yx(FWY)xxD motif
MSARRNQAATALALATACALALLPSAAAKPHATTVVKAASNAHLGNRIVVDAHGHTLYRLRPETTRHLLCKSSICLGIWKPLTVRSSSTSAIKAGSGVSGKLGLMRRARNSYQVTLRSYPLYTFVGDHRSSDATGQNLHSFGGTWLALAASTGSTAPRPSPMPAPSPTPY